MKHFNLYISFVLFISVFTLPLKAQQLPAYSQHLFTPETFNPARLGQGFIALGYRQQYLDLGNASPRSYFLTADLSHLFNSGDDSRIGLGISLQADQAHILHRNQLNALFAYHLINESSVKLSAGISAGLLLQQLKSGDARVNSPFDLAIFNASESQITFDGGPALSLQLNPGEGPSHFSVDASLPQVFTSDLNYYDGKIIADLQPHLLLRIAYRYQSDAFSIEPLFMYRDMLGNTKVSAAGMAKPNAAGMDAAVKASFLEDKVWLGAGLRLNADTYYFTAGVKPGSALQLQAGMELHSQLGTSVELGVAYYFNDEEPIDKPKPIKTPKEKTPTVKTPKINATTLFNDALKNAVANLSSYEPPKNTFLEELNKLEKQANDLPTLRTYEEKLQGSITMEGQIPALRNKLNNLKTYEQPADSALTKMREAISIKSDLGNDKRGETIQNNRDAILYTNRDYANRVNSLESKVKIFRANLRPEIVEVISTGTNEQIKAFFQKRLSELPSKPRDIRPLQVETFNNKPVLVYQFPNGIEGYDVNKNEFADVRGLMEHVIAQVNDIKANNLKVTSISILAQLRDTEQQLRVPAGTYKLEFGNIPLSIPYQYSASPTARPTAKTATIRRDITINDLSILKIYSMRRYLQSKNISERIDVEQSIQNKDQGALQIYTIRIYLEK